MRRSKKTVTAILRLHLCIWKQQQLANTSPLFGAWILIDILDPSSWMQTVIGIHAQLPAVGLGAGYPLLISELEFTKINHSLLFRPFLESHKPSVYPRAPIYIYISQVDLASVIVVWVEEGLLVLLTPPSFQNPLLAWVFNSIGFSKRKTKQNQSFKSVRQMLYWVRLEVEQT